MQLDVNNPDHFSHFVELNNQWIERYFELEEADKALARNPQRIIEEGGFILSIETEGEVAGVCALRRRENGFELARMAVAEAHRGKGLGNLLMEVALDKARANGAKQLSVLSNTCLEAALGLYRKHGFVSVAEGPHPEYTRCNIVLERRLER